MRKHNRELYMDSFCLSGIPQHEHVYKGIFTPKNSYQIVLVNCGVKVPNYKIHKAL